MGRIRRSSHTILVCAAMVAALLPAPASATTIATRAAAPLAAVDETAVAQVKQQLDAAEATAAQASRRALDASAAAAQSRALAESMSDLQSIQGLLDEHTRLAESLLLQQSRAGAELQEGLMRARMVPFESLLPRLRRLVRQEADALGHLAGGGQVGLGQHDGELLPAVAGQKLVLADDAADAGAQFAQVSDFVVES